MPDLVEPVQPLSIVRAREAIREALLVSGPKSEAVPGLVRNWQVEVRNWQDTDALDAAFVEGRLAYRTLSNVGKHYEYATQDATEKKVLGMINNDNYKKPLMNDALKQGGPVGGFEKGPKRAQNVEVLLNVGAAGIKRRLDPENFVKSGPLRESKKFSMGLHELSAHLLDPRGYTLKGYSGTTLVVLLPLPLPQDVSLFYELRRVAKEQGSPAFRAAMEIVATQFIRPKLGSSLDMGTTYVYKPATTTSSQSVKYVKAPTGATSQESPEQCRLNVKTNYRDILSGEVKGANEITLAVRKFGNGNKFPTFAIGDKDSDQLKEIEIELVAPNNGAYSGYRETGWGVSSADFKRTRV
jgi:hypothetical protein